MIKLAKLQICSVFLAGILLVGGISFGIPSMTQAFASHSSDRIEMCNVDKDRTRSVSESRVERYLANGYVIGACVEQTSDESNQTSANSSQLVPQSNQPTPDEGEVTICYVKRDRTRTVDADRVQRYLDRGYVLGACGEQTLDESNQTSANSSQPSSNSSPTSTNDETENDRISICDVKRDRTRTVDVDRLQRYLDRGYELGACGEQASNESNEEAQNSNEEVQNFNEGTVLVMSESTTTICHAPPGNPSNAHTISVGLKAVDAHLRNHAEDHTGPCQQGADFGESVKKLKNQSKGQSSGDGKVEMCDTKKDRSRTVDGDRVQKYLARGYELGSC